MLTLMFALAAAAHSGSAPAFHAASRPTPCEVPTSRQADASRGVRVRPLGEQPPGKLLLGVLRSTDGCYRPVVLVEEVGRPRR